MSHPLSKKKKSKCRNRAFPSSFADPFWFFFLDEDEAAFPHLTTRGSLGVQFFLSLLIAFGSVRTEAGGWAHSTFLPFFFLFLPCFMCVSSKAEEEDEKKGVRADCTATLTDRILMLIRPTGPTNTCTHARLPSASTLTSSSSSFTIRPSVLIDL